MFWCLVLSLATCAKAQAEDELTARGRLFPGVGPGLKSVVRGPDGNLYVLSAPGGSVLVFDEAGKLVRKIPDPAPGERGIIFGEDLDVDAKGSVYVADRGANAVRIWDPDGKSRSFSVNAPISVVSLPDGEVAVVTFSEPYLVVVFGRTGRVVREFGEPEQVTERRDLNRFLNLGRALGDASGQLYYAFQYLPEPLVRQFDRHGYGRQDIAYTAIEAMPEAQAVRREIDRQEKKSSAPSFKKVLTAIGVDRTTGEVWMALHNTLLRFDKDGSRRASYQLYTRDGMRLDASVVVVEKNKLIIGADPLGVFEFARPDLSEK